MSEQRLKHQVITLRALAGDLARAVGAVAQHAAEQGHEPKTLHARIDALLAAQKVVQETADEMERIAAVDDPKATLCEACQRRQVIRKGNREVPTCEQGRDMDRARVSGNCPGYLAVPVKNQ